jgi:hypothetical protein
MRRFKPLTLLLGTCLWLSGCGGGSGIHITEGNQQIGAPAPGTMVATSNSTVVHVDMFERIATVRNGRQLPQGFLVAKDRQGNQTAVLKSRPKRPIGLLTADILEGEPRINDLISPASDAESARLGKIYRDAEAE